MGQESRWLLNTGWPHTPPVTVPREHRPSSGVHIQVCIAFCPNVSSVPQRSVYTCRGLCASSLHHSQRKNKTNVTPRLSSGKRRGLRLSGLPVLKVPEYRLLSPTTTNRCCCGSWLYWKFGFFTLSVLYLPVHGFCGLGIMSDAPRANSWGSATVMPTFLTPSSVFHHSQCPRAPVLRSHGPMSVCLHRFLDDDF